ncbi:MAG TPA: choice-of-anchor Q domain-containing protein [Rubrobacter sp.]|nr:choice-of-anchor Q domain-containing protein [Rubrobacter sp.]
MPVLAVVALMAAMLLAARPAHATTYTVNSTDDVGDQSPGNGICDTEPFQVGTRPKCTLRAAIEDANAATGADTVTVPAGAYTLTRANGNGGDASTGDLNVTGELTITGAGARATRVVGVGGELPFDDRIFSIQPTATATITGLTITGGKPPFDQGGGVLNRGDLTLARVAVRGNTATFEAGGIYSAATTFNRPTLNIIDSTVSGNSVASEIGVVGGIEQDGGIANITNSTISGNRAATFGGGVAANEGAHIFIRNSTIASNTSGRQGGGIEAFANTSVLMHNTIVAGNSVDDCEDAQSAAGIFSQGNNISSDDSCHFSKSTDKRNTNPLLGPLQDNGGPTDTRALLGGSPAIDRGAASIAGSDFGCPATDQRGVSRPQGPRCDIGAFERPNGRPVARNDSYRGVEDRTLFVRGRGVLGNDTDPDRDALRATLVSRPGKGKLTLRPGGAFTYKPKKNFSGTVRFVYRASDGRGGTDTATVSVRIRARPG